MDMSIIRVCKDKYSPYFVMSNKPINNCDLTREARGLLTYLLSKPDNWEISMSHLIKQSPSGKSVVYRIVKELMQHGYIARKRKRGDKGQIEGRTYIIYENGRNPKSENPDAANQDTDNPDTDNQPLINTDINNYGKKIITNKESVAKATEHSSLWGEVGKVPEGKRGSSKKNIVNKTNVGPATKLYNLIKSYGNGIIDGDLTDCVYLHYKMKKIEGLSVDTDIFLGQLLDAMKQLGLAEYYSIGSPTKLHDNLSSIVAKVKAKIGGAWNDGVYMGILNEKDQKKRDAMMKIYEERKSKKLTIGGIEHIERIYSDRVKAGKI